MKFFLPQIKFLWQKKSWVLVGAILSVILFFVGKKILIKKPESIITQNPQYQDLKKTLDISGVTRADSQAILRFQSVGKLAWVGVKEGDHVDKWQAIASLDQSALKKSLEKSLNTYMTQRLSTDQTRIDEGVLSNNFDLFTLSPTIRTALDQDQLALDNKVIDVELQDIANKLATLYSPIEGIVTQMSHENPGVNIALTDTFTIIDPKSLYFEADVDETDVSQLSLGQSAQINLDAFPDLTIQTQVDHIAFTASIGEGGSTVYKVKFLLNPDQSNIRLGMNGDVSILLDEKTNILTIPTSATIIRGDQTFVQITKDGQILDQEITTGLETDDFIEITGGLDPDDQVVIPQQE